MNLPTPLEMKKIMMRITQDESIEFGQPHLADQIICLSQGDIRRLIFILHDIHNAYPHTVLTQEHINNYTRSTEVKDMDVNLYKATDKLLYNYTSINSCLRLYENNKVLLPLMVQQNYIPYILNNRRTTNDDVSNHLDLIYRIGDTLSYGDIIENHIYSEQSWNIHDIHGLYMCAFPSYQLNTSDLNPTLWIKAKFANDLHKTSIKNINKKNIANSNKSFNDLSIDDYLYISKIVRGLIQSHGVDYCLQFLAPYKLKTEQIETILKIDKIDGTKISLKKMNRIGPGI